MLSISHSLSGAFLAAKLQNPLLYIPAAIATHYLQDWILHWDVGTGLTNGSRKKLHAFLFELVDLGIAGGMVWLFTRTQPAYLMPHMWVGAVSALIPDFIEAPRNFFNYNPWFLKPFNKFHHAVHRSTPNVVQGLWPQVAVVLGIFWFR